MVRHVVGFVVGVVAAGLTVAAVESAGHLAFPPPEGVTTSEQIAEYARSAPWYIFVPVLLAWFAAAFVGGVVAARIAGRAPRVHAGLIAAIILAAGTVNLVLLPHPLWFTFSAPAAVVAAGWLAARAGRATSS